eukprot:GHVU01226700.1.p1 GENE.GHVU01226700.1~~GHVU01226700.1.p1  ORF type:complete len:681 (+),score=149.98 GHVU01226700.1:551-2593(+)
MARDTSAAGAGGGGGGAVGGGGGPVLNNNSAAPRDIQRAEEPECDPSTLSFSMAEDKGDFFSQERRTVGGAAVQGGPATERRRVFTVQIQKDKVSQVKAAALNELKIPLLSEYDFRLDFGTANMDIALRPVTKIRYYQERALRRMFSNGRARSGLIVLPCGAGKTLVGIVATCTIRKSAFVVTTNNVAVDQWRRQFIEYTTLDASLVKPFTGDSKQELWGANQAGVLITTYSMLTSSGPGRATSTQRVIDQIQEREWGLLIFDEVQFAPAPKFSLVNDWVKCQCKLGLTATLVREDGKIRDLQWLIGPKLYEANWMELQEARFLAKPSCKEVWCPMTPEFFRAYINAWRYAAEAGANRRDPSDLRRMLWICNPNKLIACESLIRYHKALGHRIIVFSDYLFALLKTAELLGYLDACVIGQTTQEERRNILNKFTNGEINVIFLSRVGDNSIDLPSANVVIQISFKYGSRRQEAQRLGRILRPKPASSKPASASPFSSITNAAATGTGSSYHYGYHGQGGPMYQQQQPHHLSANAAYAGESGEPDAFFYSLVSQDTQELIHASKRQRFLVDQGYSYTVMTMHELESEREANRLGVNGTQSSLRVFEDKTTQANLLDSIRNFDKEALYIEPDEAATGAGAQGGLDGPTDWAAATREREWRPRTTASATSLAHLSGAGGARFK